MKKKTNPTIKLKNQISNLEWKINQLEEYRTKYSDIKEKYDNEFGKKYFILEEQNNRNYRDNQQLLEIVRWLINPDTANSEKVQAFVLEQKGFTNQRRAENEN